MMDGDRMRELRQRLQNARRQGRAAQTQALLSAFAKIDDAVFREQMVILLEIIGSKPELVARAKMSALCLANQN